MRSFAAADVSVEEIERDVARVAVPRPQIQLIVRFGPTSLEVADVHVFGVQQTVRRKHVGAGQRAVTARLPFGASAAVLGVPSSDVAGRAFALEDLWPDATTRRLREHLGGARSMLEAASVVERAISERLAAKPPGRSSDLVDVAADRLATANVSAVAAELGVSGRHLHRLFLDAVGIGPKAFAKLMRFRRALHAARATRRADWAAIAVSAGYYDQAHLIDDFRSLAGVTPRTLLGELARSSVARAVRVPPPPQTASSS